MKDVLDLLDEGVLVRNKKNKICYCNLAILELIEVSRETLQGKDIEEYLILDKCQAKQMKQLNIAWLKKANGQRVCIKVKCLKKHWKDEETEVYLIKDITREKKIELYEYLMSIIKFPMWIKDEKETYCFVNEAFMQEIRQVNKALQNQSKEDIIGKTINEVIGIEGSKEIKKQTQFLGCTQTKPIYDIINSDEKDKKDYIGHEIEYNNEFGEKFILGGRNSIKLFKKVGRYITEEESRCLDQISVILDDKVLDIIWSNFEVVQNLQVDMAKELQANLVALGIFTKSKQKCLISYIQDKSSIEKLIVSITPSMQEKLRKLEKEEWTEKNKAEIEKIIQSLIIDSIEDKSRRYEVYPVKRIGGVFGIIVVGFNNNGNLNVSYTMQLFNRQLASLIRDKVMYYVIKEHLKREKEIEKELQCLVEAASDLIVVLDEEGTILKTNGARDIWTQRLGWQTEELVGHCYAQFIHPKDREKRMNIMNEISTNRIHKIERVLTKDGKYVYCEWNINYIEDQKIYICTARDISEERERELERKAYKQAKEIEKIRNQFFANISHEFRTPLNIILSSTKLLDRYVITNKAEEKSANWCIDKIQNNTFRLLKLSNNLIDLTKMDMGNTTVNLQNKNIVSIIEDITLSAVPYAIRKGIDMIFNTEEEEIILACDEEKIERIILNLLSNAIKFTPKGGKIEVEIGSRNDTALIKVKDTGVGIPNEKISTIFERFVQVDTSMSRICEGSGIGLSIAKQMVELHDGEIQVDSKINEGSIFTVELPIRVVNSKEANRNNLFELRDKIEQAKIEFSDIYYNQDEC